MFICRTITAWFKRLEAKTANALMRAEADITKWIEYFCGGVADSFENVQKRALEAAGAGAQDHAPALRRLDPRQRRALELFRHSDTITSQYIAELFGISQRSARNYVSAWVADEFLFVADAAKKSRKYGLAGNSGRFCR